MEGTFQGKGIAFLEETLNASSDACIDWPYKTTPYGYGKTFYEGVVTTASRVMCAMAHGKPNEITKIAGHSCGRAICVNPRHLSWITPSENGKDMWAHGTCRSDISDETVSLVRDEINSGVSAYRISKKYRVAEGSVFRIWKGHRLTASESRWLQEKSISSRGREKVAPVRHKEK